MSVRLLIPEPPAFRTSGASDVLVPEPEYPQTAQSSFPSEVRSASTPFSASVPVSEPAIGAAAVTHCENVEVLPAESVAVAVSASPTTGVAVDVRSNVPVPPVTVALPDATYVAPSPAPLASQEGES